MLTRIGEIVAAAIIIGLPVWGSFGFHGLTGHALRF
jgi:hypothetical protein